MSMNELSDLANAFRKVMSEYGEVYNRVVKTKDYKNPFRELINKEIPLLLKNCVDITDPYVVEGGYGKGLWTTVPWIAIRDSRITTSVRKGVYPVYLFNKDTKELFLSLAIGATSVAEDDDNAFVGMTGIKNDRVLSELSAKARSVRDKVDCSTFSTDGEIHSGADSYDSGCICYI